MTEPHNFALKSALTDKYSQLLVIYKERIQRLEKWSSLMFVIIVLLIWEMLVRAGLISKLIFPAPTSIFTTWWDLLLHGDLMQHFFITLTRMLSGFSIGGGLGLLLGLTIGWSKRLRIIFDPIIAAAHPIPKISLLPMVIIFFGIGESSRVAMVSIGSFFPMVINTMAGVLQVNPTYFEVAENYGANRWNMFRKVVVPGSMPMIFTGARLALQMSLTISISIEMIFSNNGLGSIAWVAWQTLRLTYLFSVLIMIAIMGVTSNFTLQYIKKWLLPWHHEVRMGR